ncbi:DUF5687 family protein [soil metagenome]
MLKSGRQILLPLLKLSAFEIVRSISFTRNMLTGIFVFFVLAYLFLQMVGVAIFLGLILRNYFNIQDIPAFLSTAMIYYLLAEFIFRFFMQKPPTFDFGKYLHLPIRRAGIVHFLFVRSLFSFFSIVIIILFTPITISELSATFGPAGAATWLATVFFLSTSLHWLVLLIKRSARGGLLKGIAILSVPSIPIILFYFDVFNTGMLTAPFFYLSFSSPVPLIISAAICFVLYIATFSAYYRNAYTERSIAKNETFFTGGKINFLSGYGLAGKLADTELQMILRHKKSRGYLIVSVALLFYGLLFYQTSDNGNPAFSSLMYLFIGAFITGSFVLQYGQLLLSWNSAYFDFFMAKKGGLAALIKSKYLLFLVTMLVAYVLTLPYFYFGWEIVVYHTAALFYNAGIGVHLIIYMSLWKPKPMDINKGAMFNYDGVGIAQFVMIIPYILVMYAIFFLFRLFLDDYGALIVLGSIGMAGLIFQDKLLDLSIKKLHHQRHNISGSFRQEL